MKPVVLALLLLATPAAADDAAIALGKALAQKNCTTCHAIGTNDKSPIDDAPPFRDIALGYDLMDLEDSLNEGVATEHPLMPDWQMTPEQAHALASFVMSLAPAGKLKSDNEPGSQPALTALP
jgi:mono/diheme cytochrome c family protein